MDRPLRFSNSQFLNVHNIWNVTSFLGETRIRVCFFSGNLIGKATDLKKVPTDLDEKQHKTPLKKDGGSDYRVEKQFS